MGSTLKAHPECKPSLSLSWVFAGAPLLISVFLPSSRFRLFSWKQPRGTGSQVTTFPLTASSRLHRPFCSHSVGSRILIRFVGGFISSHQGSAWRIVGPEHGPGTAPGDFAARARSRAGDDRVRVHSPRCMPCTPPRLLCGHLTRRLLLKVSVLRVRKPRLRRHGR